MELKNFVEKVLTDLVSAVESSRKTSSREMHLADNKDSRTIEFDIAVSVEEWAKEEGNAWIKVLEIVEWGWKVSKESKSASISRVKFGVYVSSKTKEQSRQYDSELSQALHELS